ncbi:MAG TPA: protein kinase [Thermoanaerobaculia bacterium]|jgi:serine/threonine protein kinase/predicted ATPase
MSSRPSAISGTSAGDAETTLDTPSAPGGAAAGPSSQATDAVIQPGLVINGRYRVDRLLARGGMGGVYRVDDQLFPGRPTALKIFLHPLQNTVELFRAEFKTMASLRHPNVARVYDFEQVAGVDAFFFTMELLPGVPLDRFLAAAPPVEEETVDTGSAPAPSTDAPPHPARPPLGRIVPWQEALDLLVPVIRALAYLHGRGVVHFDLKPGNIVVDSRGAQRNVRQIKVVDFGLAGLRGIRGLVMGTPHYVSPEIASAKEGDHRADLYSLGIMAFKLLTGETPYSATQGLDVLLKQKMTEPVRFTAAQAERIPPWLREIVERLCSVRPSERPASAGELLDLINRAGSLAYELETRDTRENYLFSSAFVGRKRELEDVQRSADAGLKGEKHAGLFVTGRSGMGKSRLMREVRQAVQLRGVPFLEVDCFERDLTESGPMANLVLQAAHLARSVGAQSLLNAHAPEMVKLVPSLPLDAGVEPTPPLPNADAERRRVIEAIAAFLVGLGRVTPYVAYVNDVQWARSGTVDIASALLALRSGTGSGSKFCLLGSYRIDDVTGRPLARLIQPGPERPAPRVVELEALHEEDVAGLLRSMLGLAELPEGLVARVTESSEGLPFFVEEILRDILEEGRLWAFEEQEHADSRIAEGLRIDAAASFLKRAARVSVDERSVLDILAVSGRPVDSDVLVDVSALAPQTAREALQILGEKQMVVAIPGERERYNLAHDRMREALYAGQRADAQTALHLGLGRSLARALAADGRWETLFEAVAHFGQALDRDGSGALAGEAERTSVARLHLRAAAATNATGAFSTGVSYLERARALLPERPWERDYDLALAVDHALAATLIPLGRVDEALATADRIVANARGALDESPGWEARILAYAALNEYPKAIAAGLEICGRLGLALPPDPTRLDIARILGRVLWKVRNMTDETLATLPEVQDPRALRLIRIMSSMTACAYVSRPYLWPVLIGNCLTLMLRHGRGPTHALLFVWFGTALNAVGLYGASPRFSRLGIRLMEAPDGAAFLPKLHHAMGQFVSHWREPIARSVEWCREGYALGRRVEDAEFAGYCHMGWAKARLETGEPLSDVRATALDALETVKASGQIGTEVMHRTTIEAVDALMGLAAFPAAGDDAASAAELSNTQNAFRLLDRARLLCFFRRSGGPALGTELLKVSEIGLPATFFLSIGRTFACLNWMLEARRGGAFTKIACLLRVRLARGRIRKWARLCPHNFEHRSLLVDAEWLRTTGRTGRSLRKYEEAIAAAIDHGFVQDAGLAHELAAEMLAGRGESRAARSHVLAAMERYRAWGADAKVLDLETRYAPLLDPA